MRRVLFGLLALALVTGHASPLRADGIVLTIRDGRATLDAQDVTIRQILTEWERVGKTRIVNLERTSASRVTLKFDGLPEDQALDIILQALPGYFAARRAVPMADASIYDRIALMTTTTPVVTARPRPQGQPFQDPSANVTQLRAAPPPLMNPGMLPDQPGDQRDANDPALAAAAAAGLTAVPAPMPTGLSQPMGPLQPPVRNAGAPAAAPLPQPTPSNPWNMPVGTPLPGLAPPPPPPSTTPPPSGLIGGSRPQQADR
jgi:hypothetical protein